MTKFLFVSIFFFPLLSSAYMCPAYLKGNESALKAWEFVQRFQGRFQLGKCQIEILACDGWGDGGSEGKMNSPIAEILIVDHKGREAYTAISYPVEQGSYISTVTKASRRRLHYEKKDRLYEDEFGRTEVTRLEFKTHYGDEERLKYIHLGTYSTNNALNDSNGNDSMWYICEE